MKLSMWLNGSSPTPSFSHLQQTIHFAILLLYCCCFSLRLLEVRLVVETTELDPCLNLARWLPFSGLQHWDRGGGVAVLSNSVDKVDSSSSVLDGGIKKVRLSLPWWSRHNGGNELHLAESLTWSWSTTPKTSMVA